MDSPDNRSMTKTIENEMNDRVALQLGRLILLGHQKDAQIMSLQVNNAELERALAVRPVPSPDDAGE